MYIKIPADYAPSKCTELGHTCMIEGHEAKYMGKSFFDDSRIFNYDHYLIPFYTPCERVETFREHVQNMGCGNPIPYNDRLDRRGKIENICLMLEKWPIDRLDNLISSLINDEDRTKAHRALIKSQKAES